MGQSVDLVVDKEGSLCFIEAKVSDWKRAIDQCRTHELVADYIFIAISTVRISPAFYQEAKRLGYGIIHFNWNTKEISYPLQAKLNKTLWMPQRKEFENKLFNSPKNEYSTLDVVWDF